MNKKQEKAEHVLLQFYWTQSGDDEMRDTKYDEFREDFNGILFLVVHKHFGWSSGITEEGYESVMRAYGALEELGYLDEITDEDIKAVLEILHPES